MQLGEPVYLSALGNSESEKREPCKRVYLHAFRGNRVKAFIIEFKQKLQQSESGMGPGPSMSEVLVYTGHVGISFEAKSPIFGFNPNSGVEPVHEVLERLKGQESYPGHVTDDTSIFDAARSHGLKVVVVEIVYPESQYNEIKSQFEDALSATKLRYGFPGAGDCNCATFPARVGVPTPEATGNMKTYMQAMEQMRSPKRMGDCEG